MKTNCNKSRKTLLESGELELLTPALEEAKLHVEHCADCRLFIIQSNDFRNFIKSNIPFVNVPASLKEEVLQKISAKKERNNSRRSYRRIFNYYSAAALLIIVLLISYLMIFNPDKNTLQRNDSKLTEELVDDYIRYRLSESPVEFATNSPDALNNWFSGKVDFNARFSSFNNKQLVGGRLCYLFDRRVALAFYKNPDTNGTSTSQWTSLFIFKDNNIDISDIPAIELKNHAKPGEVKVISKAENKGFELAIWKQGGLVYAIVSDADILELINQIN